jgi:hypothetical protein
VSDTSAQDRYLGRVNGLRIALADMLPPGAFAQADSLIEHGEPAEGVCYLAWALHNAGVQGPGWVVRDVQDLTEGLVEPEHLPPGFRLAR